MSSCKSWPDDWPRYKQACFASWNDACDMLVGPCCCGASHGDGEFELVTADMLFRYGQLVPISPEARQ